MIPLEEPIRGARQPEHLRCEECGGSVRWTARARTPEGFAAVERYRCEECDARGRQVVRPDTSSRFAEIEREYDGVREQRTPRGTEAYPVSYTHLTLPTIYSV